MVSLFQSAMMDGWSDVLYINYYGCDKYGYDDYIAMGYNCTPNASGFLAVAYFGAFIVLGAMEMEAEKELLRRVEELRVHKGVDQTVVSSYMQVLRMLDLDNSGSVEEAELRIGLAAIGKNPSYEELKEMMDVVDEDGSGQIDIVEFVEFMIHVRGKSDEQKAKMKAEAAAREEAERAAASGGTLKHASFGTQDGAVLEEKERRGSVNLEKPFTIAASVSNISIVATPSGNHLMADKYESSESLSEHRHLGKEQLMSWSSANANMQSEGNLSSSIVDMDHHQLLSKDISTSSLSAALPTGSQLGSPRSSRKNKIVPSG
ncbi:Ion transport protein, partial [Globisporangium splendens]